MNRLEAKNRQRWLKENLYYKGKIDGIWGPKSREAYFLSMLEGNLCGHVTPPRKPRNRKELEQLFGPIRYTDKPNGWIKITNNFSRRELVTVDLPIVGRKRVHRLLQWSFWRALDEIERMGYAGEIKQFGTVAARHILHNPKKPLSLHSYGIACDINWKENKYGQKVSKLHPAIVAAFIRQGFQWGGYWKHIDLMHFEYTVAK